MKTIEAKRYAVILHCAHLCPDLYQEVSVPVVNIAIQRKEHSVWFWTVDDNGNRAGALMGTLSLVSPSPLENSLIERLYRILGLEAAEAVERQKDQLVYFCGLYNDECARAAKLVEALEKISKQVVRVGIDNMWAVQNKFQEIADAALAAHKKGGAQG